MAISKFTVILIWPLPWPQNPLR